jgi:DNA replication protein DnaC
MSVEAVTRPCVECGADVVRELPEGKGMAFAKALPFVCDRCVERLDAEETERVTARHRSVRVAGSNLPDRYRGLLLDELDHPESVLRAARSWVVGGGGLLLCGEIGRGKTTIAGAACWAALQRYPVIWTSCPELLARLGDGSGTGQRNAALATLMGRRALVLDDVDKVRPTPYGAEQVFLAINSRVEHQAALLVTTNLVPSQLAEKWPEPYGPAIASRLVGYSRVVRVEGVDRRLEQAMVRRSRGAEGEQ